jgi:hypothetical protein
MVGIWQADVGKLFSSPVLLEDRERTGSNCQNLHTAAGEFLILIPQAR